MPSPGNLIPEGRQETCVPFHNALAINASVGYGRRHFPLAQY